MAVSGGGDPQKYALRAFSRLFKMEEMKNGMIEPTAKVDKAPLDQERVDLLKSKLIIDASKLYIKVQMKLLLGF